MSLKPVVAPYMVIRIPESRKFLLVEIKNLESRKILIGESGIVGFGTRITAQRIRNSTNDSNPEWSSTDKDWNQVLGIRNTQCGIKDPRLPWILLHGTIVVRKLKQRRFWATDINQNWGRFPLNMPWQYKICIAQLLYSYSGDLTENLDVRRS